MKNNISSDFVIRGSELVAYRGSSTYVHVPDVVRTIRAGAFDANPQIASASWVSIRLPPALERLRESELFWNGKISISLPDGYLQTSRRLPEFTNKALERHWSQWTTPEDYVAMYLFQSGELLRTAHKNINALKTRKTGSMILERLGRERLDSITKDRAFARAEEYWLLRSSKLPEDYEERLLSLYGAKDRDALLNLVLRSAEAPPETEAYADPRILREGAAPCAVKTAIAGYLALGRLCLRLGAEPRLVPKAEAAAADLDMKGLQAALPKLLPEHDFNEIQKYPYLRFADADQSEEERGRALAGAARDAKDLSWEARYGVPAEGASKHPIMLNSCAETLFHCAMGQGAKRRLLDAYLRVHEGDGFHPSLFSADGLKKNCAEPTILPDVYGRGRLQFEYVEGWPRLTDLANGSKCSATPAISSTGRYWSLSSDGPGYYWRPGSDRERIELLTTLDYGYKLAAWSEAYKIRSYMYGKRMSGDLFRWIFGDPLLSPLAEEVVWEQRGARFVWREGKPFASESRIFAFDADCDVRAAHPAEMSDGEWDSWLARLPKDGGRPFYGLFPEPVYRTDELQPDRFLGCALSLKRVRELHGEFRVCKYQYDEVSSICVGAHGNLLTTPFILDEGGSITLDALEIDKIDRKASQILYCLDRWTSFERAKRDDISVMKAAPAMKKEEQKRLLRIALDEKAPRLTAALLELLHNDAPGASSELSL